MQIRIDKPYLWIPTDKHEREEKLHFYLDGEKIHEADIRLGTKEKGYMAFMDLHKYLGKTVEIQCGSEEKLQELFCSEELPAEEYPYRPLLHFAPRSGWHNDPNGMIYADGRYHLFYQWNPYGVTWGNMHWGHAVSEDLSTWEDWGPALVPDKNGTVYSGCAIQDHDNVSGLGKDALLFYYTAAGGRNQWSTDEGNRFCQRLAYSLDGGKTLKLTEHVCVPFVVNENRDPKVFYHEESRGYIMILYLDGNAFAIYRSDNLLDWEETQKFEIPGMWECPDLFSLPVKNQPGEKQWVFWSADGYYMVGDFDGYQFLPREERKMAYSSRLPYAAQTFSGTGDRVISMAWLRMKNTRGNYCGLMSLPTVLSLYKETDGYRICFDLVEELSRREEEWKTLDGMEICSNGKGIRLLLESDGTQTGEWRLNLGKLRVSVDFTNGSICALQEDGWTVAAQAFFQKEKKQQISMIIDQEAIEFFAEDGKIYGVAELEENILGKRLTVTSSESPRVSCRWCTYKND